MVTVTIGDYTQWRDAARRLLAQSLPPDRVAWFDGSQDAPLPFSSETPYGADLTAISDLRVPRAFSLLAELASCHRSADKWDTLYRVLWLVTREGRQVLEDDVRDEIRAIKDLAAHVRRDEHQMRAFMRFVPVSDPGGTRYVAWYKPDHDIVRRAAPFFADRFGSMTWSILTPYESVHWDRSELSFSAGVVTPPAGRPSDIEQLWRVYYEAVFNPSRLNTRAMHRDMPVRRWRTLPEASLIPRLVTTAHERTDRLNATQTANTARPFVPSTSDLDELRNAASGCRGCRLHETATQVVFGEGPRDAEVVLVGEQPGDAEDLAGRPFVGPAGVILDRALSAAGIDRRRVYVTNAVKHFSFEPRGRRRIHQTPRMSELHACRPWLESELQSIRPSVIVMLGATAARALLGPQAQVMALRGRVLEGHAWAPRLVVTLHPSAILRSDEQRDRYFEMLVSDLALARAGLRISTAHRGNARTQG